MAKTVEAMISDRHRAFADECVRDFNGKRAWAAVGGSKRTAAEQSCQVLQRPEVQAYLAERKAQRRARMEIEEVDLLRELAKIAFANMGDDIGYDEIGLPFILLGETTEDHFAAISQFGTAVTETSATKSRPATRTTRARLKFHSRLDAIDKLAKHLGLYERDNAKRAPEIEAVGALVGSVQGSGPRARLNTPRPAK